MIKKFINTLKYISLSFAFIAFNARSDTIKSREVIIDTDVGTDIDDAFALALAAASPDLKIDLIMASSGDTDARAKLARRFLDMAGRTDIPVTRGPSTLHAEALSQKSWAQGQENYHKYFPDAVEKALQLLRTQPNHTITLIGLAPPSTIAAMISRDSIAFRRLRAIVLMAGSIHHGYGKIAGTNSSTPSLETNASLDPSALRAILTSGVPIQLMPLDATEVALSKFAAEQIFHAHTPVTDSLQELTQQWAAKSAYGPIPTLFDVVPVAYLIQPNICTLVPMHLSVSERGDTVQSSGPENVSACLSVNSKAVVNLLVQRIK
ncbi:nucleoside hydrolase [Gluconobacter sphaericus]|uniref:Inosine-uridine preferring nucleoside hydrolase n=1 Tax=Gluconobacter sphaericus NBRC 12467 TaxID=1307951 RepID=A0AA37SGU5_9PROT|nr:nucleoside hydrolase [Gluconobacter sphaericus]MBF0886455.1 nucleoside hydrolase [Gluconobacter sphaericus]GBR56812.1 inosine-uridine nucleoside N-ribohydrolase [Gluconobacter sphaericus NBRC 12467]GLQ85427.1 inosine-uridine preferring nucleoside hydrolase [Gluconobacter sphaericus NBRC 12467]